MFDEETQTVFNSWCKDNGPYNSIGMKQKGWIEEVFAF